MKCRRDQKLGLTLLHVALTSIHAILNNFRPDGYRSSEYDAVIP